MNRLPSAVHCPPLATRDWHQNTLQTVSHQVEHGGCHTGEDAHVGGKVEIGT